MPAPQQVKAPSPRLVKTMNFLTWIVYIGLLIKAGTYLFEYLMVIFVPGFNTEELSWHNINFPELYEFSFIHYSVVVFFMIIITGVKAYAVSEVTDLLKEKTLSAPFRPYVAGILMRICYALCAVGIIALLHNLHNNWLRAHNAGLKGWDDADWLYAAGLVYIIASVFKRGIVLQTENDLTV